MPARERQTRRPVQFSDIVVLSAFAFGGLFEGWIGEGRWPGLYWATLTLVAGVYIGALLERSVRSNTKKDVPP